LAVAALLMAVGPAIYLAGIVLDTAAVIYNFELPNDRATFYFTSILFHWREFGPAGPLLVIFGVCGALLSAFDRTRRTLWVFSITLLTYLGTRLLFATLIISFDFWRGPAPLYFELFVIPVYAIFAAQFCGRVIGHSRRFLNWSLPSNALGEVGLFSAGAAMALILAARSVSPDAGFRFPPAETAIIKLLAEETGLRPGSVFRGRTANMNGRSIDRSVNWLDLYALDVEIWQTTGNAMRTAGLHYFGVPTLFEYTPTISPFFYALTSRTLALPGDKQMRNVMVLRDLNPRILAMLGVRFVITDREFDGPAILRSTFPTAQRAFFLYEIANPNLGNYSPTTIHSAATAAAVVARLQEPDFDPTREIIGDAPGDTGELVPASGSTLTFLGAALRLQAESSGRSVLLLPLEFSRCLKATADGGEKPILFRANLLETGVLFSGRLDATLAIDTGAFLNPACRLMDFFDARTLRVGEVPQRAAQEQ
jgi:hypothetical protein